MEKFNIDIHFSPTTKSQKAGTENMIKTTHWCLVFTPSVLPTMSLTAELSTDGRVNSFPTREIRPAVSAYRLATFVGQLQDIHHLIKIHPMNKYASIGRSNEYDAVFNNCQHWVATMLVFLEALCAAESGRDFSVTEGERYKRVMSVLNTDGSKLYHSSNWLFKGVSVLGGGVGVGATALAATAAAATTVTEITVPAVVAAPGILGSWFGLTTIATEVVAITSSTLPAVAIAGAILLPVSIMGLYFGGLYVACEHIGWKVRTLFEDPRRCGMSIYNPLTLNF
ncbi:hypothetical protein GLAREA_01163 [Glarea lozoyensis ATCC 20868]|uniref:Uncharacterized protein n=1 Tax=Glarea lozoyensis (strain ATCC 20868 / MF5171) TaxID=1116229 RepID=S3DUA2_GLAL2|nr:uncharacterized protein GLAREA_01163 [Glarea lozoyensis ATCC 20868]EPE30003.1 hypothetical protein GLAREA_01163 [Glarea lozoyensis ATCC 20868]